MRSSGKISLFKFSGFYARGAINNRAPYAHFNYISNDFALCVGVLRFKARARINPIYAPIHLSLSTSRSLSLQSSLCSACLASIARNHIRELS